MVKYLILSTVIILSVAVLATAWANRDLIRIKIGSAYADVRAKPGGAGAPPQLPSAALRGDAPWALSALPECLTQVSESSGPASYVRGRLPRGAAPIVPPATLVYGDCTITIAGDQADVRRGADRLHIPPSVQFYRGSGLLALMREDSHGAQLRVYEPVQR
ncbi:MAG TPA: hypothetical protein VMT95_12435 [Candidatus Binatia bacterium]|nr:hypothetical protein [Candidatus Binatia bacterium]